jgi:hypothetical protein
MPNAPQMPIEPRTLPCALLLAAAVLATSSSVGDARTFPRDSVIVRQLRERGVSLHRATSRSRLPFGVPTDVYMTPGGELHVFRFKSQRGAVAASRTVRPEGYTIARRGRILHLDWIAPPHWYRRRKTVVLYLGTRVRMLKALRALAGPQFAGA